jgi:hypothetical protein
MNERTWMGVGAVSLQRSELATILRHREFFRLITRSRPVTPCRAIALARSLRSLSAAETSVVSVTSNGQAFFHTLCTFGADSRRRSCPYLVVLKGTLRRHAVAPITLDLPEDVISTTTSLTLPKGLTKNQWVAIGTMLGKSDSSLRWWIADWWAYGDHRYGDRKMLATTGIFGLAFETLMDYGTVARSVKTSNRFEALSFTHHIQVATLRPAKQKRYLTQALENGWSVSELKKQIEAHTSSSNGGDHDPGLRGNEKAARRLGDKILQALRTLAELERPNRKYLEDNDGLQLLREIVEEADRASAELDSIAAWAEGGDRRTQ